MSQTEDRQERLKEIAKIAVALEGQTGCPAAMMIAQWALESKWGEKPVGHFNCFGVKRDGRHTKFCSGATHEILQGKPVVLDLEFADYDSLEDSCRDYAWLITQGAPYRAAWERLDAGLAQLSPLLVLERGYAIVSNRSGILKDAAAAPPESGIHVRLARGSLDAVVSSIVESPPRAGGHRSES